MSSASTEYGFRPHIETGETHSPFLNDRETAELTALSTLGPLALMAFDTQPTLGIQPSYEAAPALEVPDTIRDAEEFEQAELALVLHQQQNVARAAIMFAEANLN